MIYYNSPFKCISVGGTVGAIFTCPLELIKVRFQSSQGGALARTPVARPSASHSHSTVSTTSTPSFSQMSPFQSSSTPILVRSPQTLRVTMVTHPSAKCEVTPLPQVSQVCARFRITSSPNLRLKWLLKSKIIRCMLDVGQTEGYRALFKGLVPTLVGVLPSR